MLQCLDSHLLPNARDVWFAMSPAVPDRSTRHYAQLARAARERPETTKDRTACPDRARKCVCRVRDAPQSRSCDLTGILLWALSGPLFVLLRDCDVALADRESRA